MPELQLGLMIFFYFVPTVHYLIFTLFGLLFSSVSSFSFIFAVPMRKLFKKHSCMRSTVS